MPLSDKCKSWCLLVQDNTQEGIVDVDLAVVLDESEFPEFVHEKIDPRPRCANHFRQHLLRYSGKHLLRLALRAIAREQQQSARQPFLAGVEELVDQVLLDSNSYSSRSARIISFFSMTSTVVGATVVAVAMQMDWPARHPSPKKSPGPRIATTASFPVSLTTVSFTPPS